MLLPNSARQRGFALSSGPLDRPKTQQFSVGRKSEQEALSTKLSINSNLRRRHFRPPKLQPRYS